MLGAIIGDLAAWTWERDQSLFYQRLIAPKANISEVGLAVLGLTEPMLRGSSEVEWESLYLHIREIIQRDRITDISPDFNDWTEAGHQAVIPKEVKSVMHLAVSIVGGWCDAPIETTLAYSRRFHGGKEEYYLTQIAEIIYRLRQGATKQEAMEDIHHTKSWKPQGKVSLLGYAHHAWQCFLQSWDFTSALHNAMRCSYGDKHLLGALTGAIAEAMYSCEYGFIKEKYGKGSDTQFMLSLPKELSGLYRVELGLIESNKELLRTFFPKNRALTNVEVWQWFDLPNIVAHKPLSEREYQRIRLSHDTGWDARYGIYWDDGWYYVYRSGFLLNRFRVEEMQDHTYRITRIQYCTQHEEGKAYHALIQALSLDGLNMSAYSQYKD